MGLSSLPHPHSILTLAGARSPARRGCVRKVGAAMCASVRQANAVDNQTGHAIAIVRVGNDGYASHGVTSAEARSIFYDQSAV